MNDYPIIEVPEDAGHEDEPMGTKPKFWFRDREENYWLFKHPRPNTGEDWAEKVVCELAKVMGLPCAETELAKFQGTAGGVSQNFVRESDEMLLHGNELLFMNDPSYPRTAHYDAAVHTFDRVKRILSFKELRNPLRWTPPPHAQTPMHTFIGYLVLDAWVGNTDRHHENWGWIMKVTGDTASDWTVHLAPTFDHASSLGRELQDERRDTWVHELRITTYAAKGRSALYGNENDPRPLSTIDVVRRAAQSYPKATAGWLNIVACIQEERVDEIIAAIPDERMTSSAKRFATQLLSCNAETLSKLSEEMQR